MKRPKSDEPPGPPCSHSNRGSLVLLLFEGKKGERERGREEGEGRKGERERGWESE